MILRAAMVGDAAAIAAVYASYIADTASFETEAPDTPAMAERIAAGAPLYPWIVAERAGTVLGYAYAGAFSPRDAYRWMAETTIYLARGSGGQGVGRRLYGTLLATLTAQGFTQAVGRIALPNAPSLALHAALGFREVGLLQRAGWKAGRWIDVAIWQCELAPIDGEPAMPRPFAGIVVP